jgi:acetyl/propionyl-CoA carboxylase alpha subunit
VCIGPAPARDSYLKIPRIIAAAEITGADAIHPGYGFLAENAEFAETCQASNIAFIGPTAEQIRVLGDKAAARRAMTDVGVPIIPGTPGPIEDVDEALGFARDIGFPVIIKAAAGGGGKGMRVVRAADDLAAALAAARREALAAFGDDTLLVERYVERPRHVEIQIFADAHGRVVHLFERECSIQRRYQKVIEEAPSPGVDAALRARMGAAAVMAASAVGYVGAGTVEFVLAPMSTSRVNTRLQVASGHGLVTGLDLVRLQVEGGGRSAPSLGRPRRRPRDRARPTPRICAHFLPATGTTPSGSRLRCPAWKPGARSACTTIRCSPR